MYFFSDRKKAILAKISFTGKYKEKASSEDLLAPIKQKNKAVHGAKNISKIF